MARLGSLLLTLLITFGQHDVVTYEGDNFPEKLGWGRITFLDCDRSLESGSFVQVCELGEAPGPLGETDFYQRSIAEFAGAPTFFIEWRVETDAPSILLDSSFIPVVLSASGSSFAIYHVTITDERVQFLRDTFIPLVFTDVERGALHVYRVELYGEEQYAWYIDGQLIDSGIPIGPYPSAESVITWGARHHTFPNTTRWDYIRYGAIPLDGSGDFDSDSDLDLWDYYFVRECVSNSGPATDAGPGCRFADFDENTTVDLRDVASFQNDFTPSP